MHWVSDAIAPSVIATNPANLGTLKASSLSTMSVTFSEPVTANSAQNTDNYLLKGPGGSIAITGAQLDGAGTTVTISFASQVVGGPFKLFVKNVTDLFGNAISSFQPYQPADVYTGRGWCAGEHNRGFRQ